MAEKVPPEIQAAYLADQGPDMCAKLVSALALRFGIDTDDLGLVMFFCTGGHNVQMCSNLTPESIAHICAGYAARHPEGEHEPADATH